MSSSPKILTGSLGRLANGWLDISGRVLERPISPRRIRQIYEQDHRPGLVQTISRDGSVVVVKEAEFYRWLASLEFESVMFTSSEQESLIKAIPIAAEVCYQDFREAEMKAIA